MPAEVLPPPSPPKPAPLSILTFNLLAPCYKRLFAANGSERRDRECHHPHLWTARLDALLSLLLSVSPRPDVIALQEVWFHPPFLRRLEAALSPHFDIHYAKRPGCKEDGLATLISRNSPALARAPAHARVAAFPLACADRVALAVSVRLATPAPHAPAELLVVNAHLTFPHCRRLRRTRREQAEALVRYVAHYTGRGGGGGGGGMPALVLGDFNGDGDSGACKRLSASGFVNCYAQVNGVTDSPTTHCNHLGEQVFVDHMFLMRKGGGRAESGVEKAWRREGRSRSRSRRSRRRRQQGRDEGLDRADGDAEGDKIVVGDARGAAAGARWLARRFVTPECSGSSRSSSPVAVAVREKTEVYNGEEMGLDETGTEARETQARCDLTPIRTVVYPEGVATGTWPSDFDISDHRPVGIHFQCSMVPVVPVVPVGERPGRRLSTGAGVGAVSLERERGI